MRRHRGGRAGLFAAAGMLCVLLTGGRLLAGQSVGRALYGAAEAEQAAEEAGEAPEMTAGGIVFDANGGRGTMEPIEAGDGPVPLPPCQYTRYGYVFRGWAEDPSAAVCEYVDQAEADVSRGMKLYALWEPQLYIIHYDRNGRASGEMPDMYAIYDRKTRLDALHFGRANSRFSFWMDNAGRRYRDGDTVLNLHSGNTYSYRVMTVDAGKPEGEKQRFRSTQGSVVFERDGKKYLVTAAVLNDADYYQGNLEHYETVLTEYDLETGEVVKQARNLAFDHGNGIACRPSNGHIYIAEGGTLDGYPGGVMEVDENLKLVKEWNFPLLTNIWAIAYSEPYFYVIGRNKDSRNSFCVLNEDMQTLSITPVDAYYADNFSSQGIAADDSFIYAVSAGFKAYEWKSKQRINVFTHEGEYVGVWSLDIPHEAEDITVIGDYAYITTNEGSRSSLYRTRMPVVNLRAIWEPYR
ncbi:InlB B-repeat-containing protein [Lachnoclostridium sp. Marseille-P6806]|uniref:InlB B-repeat-containing protein n=1 Tax=Lachnoclostridium sp. Marseille-P6806 TaxID=2364793 RepID=UPI0013EF3954|nr:InlB B-repeat-containing protein [Lachnoclostridium sp. Marseille-P6806]